MSNISIRKNNGLQQSDINAEVATALYKFGLAFPFVRMFSEQETAHLNALWAEIFKDIAPDIFCEAADSYLKSGLKFPVPGQIKEIVNNIMAERNKPKKGDKKVIQGKSLTFDGREWRESWRIEMGL